jgi:hypothetical protein
MLRCGTRATIYINRRYACQCFSSHASKSNNTVSAAAAAAVVDKADETIGDMKERAASLLAASPPAYATKPGLSRTQFENEYHLNRSLSKNIVTPEQRRIWQQQVKKRTWDLKPMEMHHSPPYEIQALQEIHNRSSRCSSTRFVSSPVLYTLGQASDAPHLLYPRRYY